VSSAVQDLLAVQDLDLAVDQVRHRRASLPERSELSEIDGQTKRFEKELTQVESGRTELAGRRAKAEADLAAAEQRAAAIQKRLYGGGVSASRDLQAMAGELDQLKARSSVLEDAVLEVLEAADPLDVQANELRTSLTTLADRGADARSRLADAEKALDAELAGLEDQRVEAAAKVPAGLMATYERLRGRFGGVGVARLVGNHCDGCHLALSAMELDRLRHLPDGEVFTCEQCSRILVVPTPTNGRLA
jgi:predicted  nucleic acid-binding Zn-ribbon protein